MDQDIVKLANEAVQAVKDNEDAFLRRQRIEEVVNSTAGWFGSMLSSASHNNRNFAYEKSRDRLKAMVGEAVRQILLQEWNGQ